MSTRQNMALIIGFCATLVGCTTPDTYSTMDKARLIDKDYKGQGYDPVVVRSNVKVKSGFLKLLQTELCRSDETDPQFEAAPLKIDKNGNLLSIKDKQGNPANGICDKKSTASDFACWATLNHKAKACVDAVARHAIDQCAVLVGRQNRYATKFAEWILPLQAAFGLGADAAALATAGTSRDALLATALLTSSSDVQKSIPGVVSLKASDIVTSEQNLVLVSDIRDVDVWQIPTADGKNAAVVKFSLLHDTLLSTCPAYTLPGTFKGLFMQ